MLQTRPGTSVLLITSALLFLDQFPEWLRSQTPNESFPGCHCGSAIWACRSCRSWWRCPPFALLATSSSSQVRIWLIWLGLRGSWQSSLGPRKEKLALLMKFPPQRDIDWDYLSELVSWLKQTLRNLLPYTVSTEIYGMQPGRSYATSDKDETATACSSSGWGNSVVKGWWIGVVRPRRYDDIHVVHYKHTDSWIGIKCPKKLKQIPGSQCIEQESTILFCVYIW